MSYYPLLGQHAACKPQRDPWPYGQYAAGAAHGSSQVTESWQERWTDQPDACCQNSVHRRTYARQSSCDWEFELNCLRIQVMQALDRILSMAGC